MEKLIKVESLAELVTSTKPVVLDTIERVRTEILKNDQDYAAFGNTP